MSIRVSCSFTRHWVGDGSNNLIDWQETDSVLASGLELVRNDLDVMPVVAGNGSRKLVGTFTPLDAAYHITKMAGQDVGVRTRVLYHGA